MRINNTTTFIEAVKPEEVNMSVLWDEFDRLVPELAEVGTFHWEGNGFPILPCVEYFDTQEQDCVLFVTYEQYKVLKCMLQENPSAGIYLEHAPGSNPEVCEMDHLDYVVVVDPSGDRDAFVI